MFFGPVSYMHSAFLLSAHLMFLFHLTTNGDIHEDLQFLGEICLFRSKAVIVEFGRKRLSATKFAQRSNGVIREDVSMNCSLHHLLGTVFGIGGLNVSGVDKLNVAVQRHLVDQHDLFVRSSDSVDK